MGDNEKLRDIFRKDDAFHHVKCPKFSSLESIIVEIHCVKCKYHKSIQDNKVCCDYPERLLKAAAANSSDTNVDTDPLYPPLTFMGMNPNVMTNAPGNALALDSINRDIHEPTIEELADYYGVPMDQIIS